MKILEPWGLVLIVLIVLVLFGPKRLPDLGKSFRKSVKVFKEEIEADEPQAEKPLDADADTSAKSPDVDDAATPRT